MRQGLVGLLALVGVLVGCAHAQARREEAAVARRLAYIDEVRGPATIPSGAAARMVVVGSLPDPSWALAGVEQRREGRVVRLLPWLQRTTEEPVIQVLVPFEHEVMLGVLPPGRWEVQVVGFGDALATAALEVTP
ncbi:MAG: hypothetical protein VKQ33_12870 [Candidatus Sericytochromatia bacterium]|nr:hypothetical protein [Candidatus Sericytochromatia bacterium]